MYIYMQRTVHNSINSIQGQINMKIIFIIPALLLFELAAFAQVTPATSHSAAFNIADSSSLRDTIKIPKDETPDTIISPGHNMYGDLLNDDPAYNRKYPVWIPAVRVAATNVFNWAVARYFFNYEWARISTETWKDKRDICGYRR